MSLRKEHIWVDGIEKKHCNKCNGYKPLDRFTANTCSWDKKYSYCRDCLKTIYKKNRPKRLICEKRWVANNKEKVREYKKRYRDSHPETMQAIYNRSAAKKNKTLPGKIANNMRASIRYSLCGKKNGLHWEKLVGYGAEELIKHLEGKFLEGMNWDNYSKYGWHIDHKRPIKSFNITSYDCDDFKKCWSLDNLQPLWAVDNLRKSNKWEDLCE